MIYCSIFPVLHRLAPLGCSVTIAVCVSTLAACGGSKTDVAAPRADDVAAGGPMSAVSSNGGLSSCEEAVANALATQLESGQPEPDPSFATTVQGQVDAGKYIHACGVPDASAVAVCVVIVSGSAVGVTTDLDSAQQRHADCVARTLAQMRFPSHSAPAIVRTQFAGK